MSAGLAGGRIARKGEKNWKIPAPRLQTWSSKKTEVEGQKLFNAAEHQLLDRACDVCATESVLLHCLYRNWPCPGDLVKPSALTKQKSSPVFAGGRPQVVKGASKSRSF